MDSLLGPVVRALVFALITVPVTGWAVRAMARERKRGTRSTKRFRVESPSMVRLLFAGAAVASELLMAGVWLYQGLTMGVWDDGLVWFGHGLAIACLVVWAGAGMQRLDVDGDNLRYRSIAGRVRTATFADLTKAELHMQSHMLTLYAGGGKFATFSAENTGTANLLMRLADEGVPVTDAVSGPMTKRGLGWAAIQSLTFVFLGMAVFFSLILVFMWLFGGQDVKILLLVPALIVLLGVVLPVFLFAAITARGLSMLARQERALGFSFDEEMRARSATGTSLEDEDWFVGVSNAQVIAFRRDYIKGVTKRKNTESGDECILTAKDGKKHKVRGGGYMLDDLRRWFREGPKDPDAAAEQLEESLEDLPGISL